MPGNRSAPLVVDLDDSRQPPTAAIDRLPSLRQVEMRRGRDSSTALSSAIGYQEEGGVPREAQTCRQWHGPVRRLRRRSAAFCGVRVVFVLSARTRRYPLTRRHRSSLVREGSGDSSCYKEPFS